MASIIERNGFEDILRGVSGDGTSSLGETMTSSWGQVSGGDAPGGGNTASRVSRNVFDVLTGDTEELFGDSRGGDDVLIARKPGSNYLSGDAYIMSDQAEGGDDLLIGADRADFNRLTGDAHEYMTDSVQGGDDLLIGGDRSFNFLYGGAAEVGRYAHTGSDTLIGGDYATNIMSGDGSEVSSQVAMADDLLIGGRYATNTMTGDGYLQFGLIGGNDSLIGGAHSDNAMHGDAIYLFADGGDDTLIASDSGNNQLYGDAYQMLDDAVGGDDILISGKADDQMWGDAKFRSGIYLGEDSEESWYENPPEIDNTVGGHDSFVFYTQNGNDTIHDFEQGKDLIELRGMPEIDDFNDLEISFTNGDAVIDLGEGNSITVIGVTALSESDFLFT